jgi:hypothetical protein
MTDDISIAGMEPAYMAQEGRCIQAAADYTQGRISLAAFLEECFLLVYECARLGVGLESWSVEEADEAAWTLTRHWWKFIDAIPDIKRRVLTYEKADVQTHKQQLVIESRWRKALDMIEAGYDYGDFESRPTALDKPFFECITSKETK